MRKQNLKLAIDSESINIYREIGKDEDSIHIVYWHEDEWLENPKTVVPAIIQAINLYYTDQIELLKKLNLDCLILK